MSEGGVRLSFGPVPSRRLGKSLGINNIPAKSCTYSCVYCQVGRTTRLSVERRRFYAPEDVVGDVRERVAAARDEGERVDYLTFVPDGEPTLDENLGEEIALLKPLGIPIGVITNSSLLGRADVRAELAQADWVSLKLDAVRESLWRKVNRPHRALRLAAIRDGMRAFAESFTGTLVTETLLVEGVNDGDDCLRELAVELGRLRPSTAYLSISTRPPAETWVRPPEEGTLNRAFHILGQKVPRVELLVGYEGDTFATTGDVEKDLLSITAVHPMRREAVEALLSRAAAPWAVVDGLLARGELSETAYEGHRFYLRRCRRLVDPGTPSPA